MWNYYRLMTPDTSPAPNGETEGVAMPRWVPRAIGLFWLGLIGIWVLQGLFESLSDFLLTVVISLFFSFALEPAVNWLEQKGVRRGGGTLLVFLAVVVAVSVLGFVVGSAFAEQMQSFVEDAPSVIDDVEDWLQRNLDENVDLTQTRDQFLSEDGLGQQLTGVANNAVGFGATVVGLVFDLFTIALFTFYLTADGPRLRRTICARLPPERQRRILGIWELAIQKTGGYILSRTVLASISSIVTWVAFTLIGVPFPLALAIWVGVVSQFVPVVGVYIAGSLPLILTLVEAPARALWALVFMIGYQQIENYLLAPRIDSRTLRIHPAVSFGSVIAGAAVLGPAGALLALPAAATAQGLISASGERYDIEEGPLTRIGPPVNGPKGSAASSTLPVDDFGHEGSNEIDGDVEDVDDVESDT